MPKKFLFLSAFTAIFINCCAQCPPCFNQTQDLTRPLPEDTLPYRITVKEANFRLEEGLQSFAFAVYEGEWLFISGRNNGLHNVNSKKKFPNSFPVENQNTVVYVVDPKNKKHYCRSLEDSDLSQRELELLSVTNSFFIQTEDKNTLYLVGGYGVNNVNPRKQKMDTKDSLTAIDVPGLIDWVKEKPCSGKASDFFRFTHHPILQLTGGKMLKADGDNTYLLAFGQNFKGFYTTSSNGDYSMRISKIEIIDDGCEPVVREVGKQPEPIDSYRRRDLNVIPVVKNNGNTLSYVALSGVFTPPVPGSEMTPGAWTVPIEIRADGSSSMLNPDLPDTLKQAMNNYDCAHAGIYSKKRDTMYTLLFGGISASIFTNRGGCQQNCQALIPKPGNRFTTCCNLPFTNDITTIAIDKNGVYRQYIMSEKFPIKWVENPGALFCDQDPFPKNAPRIYFFGSEAVFIPNDELKAYANGVIKLDELKFGTTFLGYIVGGIASTITDTNCPLDTIASPYIFKVYITHYDFN